VLYQAFEEAGTDLAQVGFWVPSLLVCVDPSLNRLLSYVDLLNLCRALHCRRFWKKIKKPIPSVDLFVLRVKEAPSRPRMPLRRQAPT
jgi:hypothetical protein